MPSKRFETQTCGILHVDWYDIQMVFVKFARYRTVIATNMKSKLQQQQILENFASEAIVHKPSRTYTNQHVNTVMCGSLAVL